MKSRKFVEEVAKMFKPLIVKMDKASAVALVASRYHWLDTDDLEKGLYMAEFEILAGK